MGSYRKLSLTEISTLEKNGCRAEQWNALEVGDDFVAERVHNARFIGRVRIGRNDGTVVVDGISRQCGIYNALVINCQIGDNVLISNIGSSIHNYRIEENAVIENVDLLFSEEGSQFGNGVQVRVLNEITNCLH
jgi:hypothetical protein